MASQRFVDSRLSGERLKTESWKQILQNHGDSISDQQRLTILVKCSTIEKQLSLNLNCEHLNVELRDKYEALGTKLLNSKAVPDWENVAENLYQMYDEIKRKRDDSRTQSTKGEERIRKKRIKVNWKGLEFDVKDVNIHDSTRKLKRKIANTFCCKTEDEITLLHGDKELCDKDTLDTYGITGGETIYMVHHSVEMTNYDVILQHGDKELCDKDTLETYGITNGETLVMEHRFRGKDSGSQSQEDEERTRRKCIVKRIIDDTESWISRFSRVCSITSNIFRICDTMDLEDGENDGFNADDTEQVINGPIRRMYTTYQEHLSSPK